MVYKEVVYKILGENERYLEFNLDKDEQVIADAGSMLYMDQTITMEPCLLMDDPLTIFTNPIGERGYLAFSARSFGTIMSIQLHKHAGSFLFKPSAFICMVGSINVRTFNKNAVLHNNRSLETFGCSASGEGTLFVHGLGTIVKKELSEGTSLKADVKALIAMTDTIQIEFKSSGFIKPFITKQHLSIVTLKGPGTVFMQTSRLEEVETENDNTLLELEQITELFMDGSTDVFKKN